MLSNCEPGSLPTAAVFAAIGQAADYKQLTSEDSSASAADPEFDLDSEQVGWRG